MHGDRDKFAKLSEQGESEWTEEDVLIVAGDFGFIFANSDYEREFLDELEKKPYTICFCDGNHENFPAIYSFPKEKWNGGKVHRIRKNVFHLMRGQVFTIDGKKIFTMGGAYSRDKYMRFENLSWWKEELPCDAEYKEAISNLKENENCVDYIVTHTAPRYIIRTLGREPSLRDMELTGFFDWIRHDVKFKNWFFGHWHTDRDIEGKFSALYHDVKSI
jgi:hypothetical protein